MAQGIYINEHQFVRFSEAGRAASLSEQIATRGRSTDFFSLGTLLPNPDPILKARGQDLRVYRELRSDAHVGGCVRRRKAAVKALEWGLDRGKAKSRIARNIESILADLPLDQIIGSILEGPLYGNQPHEVMWGKVGGLAVPVGVEAKPPEWFGYDDNNQLRFKSRTNPVVGEELPPMKFLVARQEPTYANPYGFPDLSMCFWPIVFKKGGVKFWLNFAEKYGTPWAVGKTPRGTQQSEKDQLADNLEAMIQDAVAVIPDDSSVEILEAAGKSASADLYERLVMYCRSEVSIALTGTNQTVEATANRASATAGLEVADDIRDGDAGIVCQVINELIHWTVNLNWGNAERPVWSMWDQEAQDSLQARRDKTLSDAGAKFSNAYFIRAYRYQEGDLLPQGTTPNALEQTPPAQFSEGGQPATTYAEVAADALATEGAQAWEAIMAQVRQIVFSESGNLEDVRDKLLQAFGDLPVERLAKVMELGFSAAELAGVADVVQETGVGGKS